ncbi:unnamed protein product [Lactuca saligna]|uniref:Uncharacterized protein n=1 Tax=Lactuca saligna TaxID=75948 RepID=A0AA35ZLS4_LACSI|nr:unnamed protein product [Lactuca saligna]
MAGRSSFKTCTSMAVDGYQVKDVPFCKHKGQKGKEKDQRVHQPEVDAAALSKKRALLPVKKLRSSLLANSKLHRTLYGFIVFQVSWKDVRGINYLNELQTDTSLAIEAKYMKRWEFDSIAQSVKCINSWFPGTPNEKSILEEHLNSMLGDEFYDAPKEFQEYPCTKDDEKTLQGENLDKKVETLENETSEEIHTPPPYKRRKLTNSAGIDIELNPKLDFHHGCHCPCVVVDDDEDCEIVCFDCYTTVICSWDLVENLIEAVMLPVWFLSSVVWTIVMSIMYPIFWFIWGILYAPISLILGVSNFVGFMYNQIYDLFREIWILVSDIFKLASNAESAVHTYEVSIWRSLWNDLFSQVFRAVRSILNGFVAFFAACNRHRLSIYNHLHELIRRVNQPSERLEGVNVNSSHESQGTRLLGGEKQDRRKWKKS